jgi:hypothetical protein
MTRAWFVYIGGEGGPLDSNNYFYTTLAPACGSGNRICAVLGLYEPSNYGSHPVPFQTADTNLESYINNAQADGARQPTAPDIGYAFVKP